MGATPRFPLSYEETKEKIRQYKEKVEQGAFEKADFWHFCGYLGVDDETVVELIRNPGSREKRLSLELKRFVSWVKGQYATSPGWSGSNGSKGLFLMKQNIGGILLTDKPESGQSGRTEIIVRFGGDVKDPFG